MATLEDIIRRLESTPEMIRASEAYVSKGLEERIEDQYSRGVDPWDRDWAPLSPTTIARGRTPPPLTDKGIMRRSSKVQGVGGVGGVSVRISRSPRPQVPSLHQSGTSKMPARKLVPEGGSLPAPWKEIVESGVRKVVEDHWRG